MLTAKSKRHVAMMLSVLACILLGLIIRAAILGGLMVRDWRHLESLGWHEMVSKEDRFRVLMPPNRKRSTEFQTNGAAAVEFRQDIAETDSTTAFGVAVSTLPDAPAQNGTNFLEATKRELQRKGLKIHAECTVRSCGLAWHEWEAEGFESAHVRVRATLANKRVYMLTAVRSKSQMNKEWQARAFFSSFRCLDDSE